MLWGCAARIVWVRLLVLAIVLFFVTMHRLATTTVTASDSGQRVLCKYIRAGTNMVSCWWWWCCCLLLLLLLLLLVLFINTNVNARALAFFPQLIVLSLTSFCFLFMLFFLLFFVFCCKTKLIT